MHAGEVVSSDRLIEELWGERAPATAAKTVQVYVSKLRKALGEGVVLTRAGGYVLDPDRTDVDVHRFEALVAEGHRALASDPRGAARCLGDALALWRGQPLADFVYEPFAQGELARLEEARMAALEDRIDADLALGASTALVGELEALVREHPLRERLCGQLMLALYRAGRQAEALGVYQRARAHLAEELGLEPSPALKAIQAQILNQDPALSRSTVIDGRGAGAFAPPRTGSVRPTNLPAGRSQLIGRDAKLAEVVDAVVTDGERLVTITGRGGAGKTSLALLAGSELLDEHPGGVWWVDLTAVGSPDEVLVQRLISLL